MFAVIIMISFGEFGFDPQQQLLYQNGQPVQLTQKQVRLLSLFLEQPKTVFSKEDILDQVWEGRAVSEQVVFQNISKLRTIISNDAIKTFPKRGYQWQLPLSSQPEAAPTLPYPQKETSKTYLRYIAPVLSVIALITVFLFLTTEEEPHPIVSQKAISALPIEARFEGTLEEELGVLNRHLADNFTSADATISAREFLNSSYMKRLELGVTGDKLLMSGILRWIKDQYFLVYRLQGEQRSWQAYSAAKDIKTLAHTITDHISLIAGSGYFTLQNEALITAELELLHDQVPNNPSILTYLIERHLTEANYDVAAAYTDKLLRLSEQGNLPAYKVTALWLKGQRALALHEFENADSYLASANILAREAELLFIQSEVIKNIADLAYQRGDFEAVKTYLTEAASLARLANEPVKEIRAYTLLSIMAAKLGFQDEKWQYLHHAKSLLADDAFDASHYMLVNYHFAIFAEDPTEKEKWYQATLSRPLTPENAWVFKSAADSLIALLITDKRWQEALAVTEKMQEPFPATAHKLKADVYIAQGNTERGIIEAREAFTLARVNGDRWIGLPVALMLLENSITTTTVVETSEYKQYIQSNLKGR